MTLDPDPLSGAPLNHKVVGRTPSDSAERLTRGSGKRGAECRGAGCQGAKRQETPVAFA